MIIGLSIKSLSPFVLLVYAGRNIKAFIVPISDYKKENKDERKIDKRYVWDVTDRFMIDRRKTMERERDDDRCSIEATII